MVGVTPDGQSLDLLTSGGARVTRLVRIRLDTGALSVVAEDPDVDVDDVMVQPATNAVEAIAFRRARTDRRALDERLRADLEALPDR